MDSVTNTLFNKVAEGLEWATKTMSLIIDSMVRQDTTIELLSSRNDSLEKRIDKLEKELEWQNKQINELQDFEFNHRMKEEGR